MTKIDVLLRELDALTKSSVGPFPYAGCRRLKAAVRTRHEALIPDLDSYLSELAGYRTWGKRILQWPDEKFKAVEARLQDSFFDRFPAYDKLKPVLASSDAADVDIALQNADRTRTIWAELLSAIRKDRAGADK